MKAITVEPHKPETARLEDIPSGTGTGRDKFWARADRAWLVRRITRREPPAEFMRAIHRQPNDIKVVIQFTEA
jgi:hypothetical protein